MQANGPLACQSLLARLMYRPCLVAPMSVFMLLSTEQLIGPTIPTNIQLQKSRNRTAQPPSPLADHSGSRLLGWMSSLC